MLKFSYRFWFLICVINIALGIFSSEYMKDSETAILNLSVATICLTWAVNIMLEDKIRESNKKATQKPNQRNSNFRSKKEKKEKQDSKKAD